VVTSSAPSAPGGAYTRADLEALPDDGLRYELIDGALLTTPGSSPLHQRVAGRLVDGLTHGLPRQLEAAQRVYVGCGTDTVLRPDVVVFPGALVERPEWVLPAARVPLVAEVASAGSLRVDSVLRRRLYADAGIAHYLLVELAEPRITWFGLGGSGAYEVRGVASGDQTLLLSEPVPVEIVPAALLRAWR
jgi:Uma2 family endonuclease